MSLWQSIALFLPLAFVISFFSSVLRRQDWTEISRATMRLFLYMSGTILALCVVMHLGMEWLLSR